MRRINEEGIIISEEEKHRAIASAPCLLRLFLRLAATAGAAASTSLCGRRSSLLEARGEAM